MPSRLPLAARRLRISGNEPYVCASCLVKASLPRNTRSIAQTSKSQVEPQYALRRRSRISPHTVTSHYSIPDRRYASNGSLASTSAVNAPTTVPPVYRELYQKLLALQDTASSYVDLSRLQLATRSLERSNTIIRVALLGLGSNGALSARKLARVLLSDVLSDEVGWEEEIVESVQDVRSLLLRYGTAEDVAQDNPLVRTMHVPSPFLRINNLEILVTAFNSGSDSLNTVDQAMLEDALLVPPLTTPNSPEGRVAFVRYPVHKAVLVAEGVLGAVEYGRFPATLTDDRLTNAALCAPVLFKGDTALKDEKLNDKIIDVDVAQHALDLFRTSKANGALFSEEWQMSRVSTLADWITSKELSENESLHPAVGNLITSLLNHTTTAISVSEDAERILATAKTVPDSKRTALQTAISEWSAEAHSDLQMNLDVAFQNSPSWRRTIWWRLFWRIDDVTISASDLLRNHWLAESEQRLAFISGRIFDAGLATETQLAGPLLPLNEEQITMLVTKEDDSPSRAVAELKHMPSLLSRMEQPDGSNALFRPLWPQAINLSRQFMLHRLVPNLHRRAQTLLATAVGTIGGSAALSAWFFIATAGHGLYESGAIFAFGLAWALRRLQRRWENERTVFASAVREDARRVLGEVEAQLRSMVHDGGRVGVRPEDERDWQEARKAVESCSEALEKIRSGR